MRTELGVKIVQLITDDQGRGPVPGVRDGVDLGEGLDGDPAAGLLSAENPVTSCDLRVFV